MRDNPNTIIKKKSYLIIFCFIFFLQASLRSQTINATLLELNFANDGYPEVITKVDNGFFFSSEDDQLWFSDCTPEKQIEKKSDW